MFLWSSHSFFYGTIVNTKLRDRTYANLKPVIRHASLATELITEQKIERRSIERDPRNARRTGKRDNFPILSQIQNAEAQHAHY